MGKFDNIEKKYLFKYFDDQEGPTKNRIQQTQAECFRKYNIGISLETLAAWIAGNENNLSQSAKNGDPPPNATQSTEWEKEVSDLMFSVQRFADVLIPLILDYALEFRWESRPALSWKLMNCEWQTTITSNHQHLFVCSQPTSSFLTYSRNGDLIEMKYFSSYPCAVECYQQEVYIVNQTQVSVINLTNQALSYSWKSPPMEPAIDRRCSLKVDQNLVYLSIASSNQIFFCDRKTGEVMKTLGNREGGSMPNQFKPPLGLTVDSNSIYVCDESNDRVQILEKSTGMYRDQWGSAERQQQQRRNNPIFFQQQQPNTPTTSNFSLARPPSNVIQEFFSPSDTSLSVSAITFRSPASVYILPKTPFCCVGDNASVTVINLVEGSLIQRIGENDSGVGEYQFDHVYGLCVIGEDLFVNDWRNGRIKVFRRQGFV